MNDLKHRELDRGQHSGDLRACGTVSASYAGALLTFAVRHGASRERLLDRLGIEPRTLADPDARLPFAAYRALIAAAKAELSDPAFALRLGADQDFDEISVVGLLCYASPTMADALATLNRFGALVAELDMPEPGNRFRLQRESDGLWLVDTWTGAAGFPEFTEETWSRFIFDARRHFPEEPVVRLVQVPHSAPEHAAAYAELWRAPVCFGSPRNAMLISDRWPLIELNHPNTYLFGVLSEHAQGLMTKLRSEASVRGQVEAILMPRLHRQDIAMATVAQELGMSRMTLARRLTGEGVTFREVLDTLRRTLALQYLQGGRTSICETAALLGFSEPSAFSRAFKRWTGAPPQRHRSPV